MKPEIVNRILAWKIMGYKTGANSENGVWASPALGDDYFIWNPCRNIEQAFSIIEKHDSKCQLQGIKHYEAAGGWWWHVVIYNGEKCHESIQKSLSLAICEAAVEAIEEA